MNKVLEEKIDLLPKKPGVYFFKDKSGQIIYIGKAVVLRNRVRQYFQNSKSKDIKTQALVRDINDLKWMEVDSEIEALFLEAELVRRYLPRYNILLRDDKSVCYIRIDYDSLHPTVSVVRHPLDDRARYFGPYLNSTQINETLKYLRHIFPFAIKKNKKRVSLDYFLGIDPGLEENKTDLNLYKKNLRKLILVIEGKQKIIEKQLEKSMLSAAKKYDFETATKFRNQLKLLQNLSNRVILGSRNFTELRKDDSLINLKKLLNLNSYCKRIEGYDISHMQGTNVVASMVVFKNGVSDKTSYRRFKTSSDINNDFANMNEIIGRRFSLKNINEWGMPDLVVIDGGKGQLDAAIKARNEREVFDIPFIGLAKKSEQIVIKIDSLDNEPASLIEYDDQFLSSIGGTSQKSDNFILLNVPHENSLLKLLQRIRDESHRFAVSYHSVLKRKNSISSLINEIPGIGDKTRLKLTKQLGSVNVIKESSSEELVKVVGQAKAKIIKDYFKNEII